MKEFTQSLSKGLLAIALAAFVLLAASCVGQEPAQDHTQTAVPNGTASLPQDTPRIATEAPQSATETPENATDAPSTDVPETARVTPFTAAPEETPVPAPVVTQIYPLQGGTVSLLSDEMTAWLSSYRQGSIDGLCDHTEKCAPVPVTFRWRCDGADYANLLVSKNPDMSGADVYLTLEDSLSVEDLLPGTVYYWQAVCSVKGEQIRSEVSSFTTFDAPRTVLIPGVSNVRDIGGKTALNGKKVRFGIIYRGADLAAIGEVGIRKTVDILGVRTELDLRSRRTNGQSSLGGEVGYISVTAPYYKEVSLDGSKAELLEELRAFANAANYPIYFHCSLGRDRTGTLAFLLLALVGVSEDDIVKDYEVSFFSSCGGYSDNAKPSAMLEQLKYLEDLVWKDKSL